MNDDELDVLQEAVRSSPDVDLPSDRRDLALLGTFLGRNPEFNTSAPDEKYDALVDLHGTDHDVYLPSERADVERLVALLKRHDDLDLLAMLRETDDTLALLEALGHGDGAPADGGSAVPTDAATDDEDDGWLSDDDEDDFLDHDDLDRFGERLSRAAGGLVCLSALLTAWFTGFTVYKSVDSWVLSVEFHDPGAILVVSAIAALVVSLGVGFVYRLATDDAYDGYRGDLFAATFEVPFFAVIVAGLLYLLSPIVLNLIALNVVDAVLYLVGLVVVLFIAGVPLLIGVFLGTGVVVGAPTFAGIYGGSLLWLPVAKVTGD